jgi:hypothetical protein
VNGPQKLSAPTGLESKLITKLISKPDAIAVNRNVGNNDYGLWQKRYKKELSRRKRRKLEVKKGKTNYLHSKDQQLHCVIF